MAITLGLDLFDVLSNKLEADCSDYLQFQVPNYDVVVIAY